MPPVLLAINKSKITFLQVHFVLLNYEVPEVKDRSRKCFSKGKVNKTQLFVKAREDTNGVHAIKINLLKQKYAKQNKIAK